MFFNLFFYRFAVERTNSAISIWFWSRQSALVPGDINSNTVNPQNWVRTKFIYICIFLLIHHLAGRSRGSLSDHRNLQYN
jgi:hypothetical protein